jgi:Mg2+-importing ATPase
MQKTTVLPGPDEHQDNLPMNTAIEATQGLSDFWSLPLEELLHRLGSSPQGVSAEEARRKLSGGRSRLSTDGRGSHALSLLMVQFTSPIVLILLFAALLSLFLGEATDAVIILSIVLASGLLGFWQEWGAADSLKKLLALVQTTASVLRDGRTVEIPVEQVVPGDVVLLHAGDIIPGDGRVLDETDLFVAEATLTGETFPVEKAVGTVSSDAVLGRRTNCVFLGTSVVSGTARILVVHTGRDTEFGRISGALRLRPPETAFERGIRRFGYLLMEVTLLLVLAIFAINVGLHRPVLDSFLFSVAIAVGLTPQLLPAIISVNLAHGARRMAKERVIVRRLACIENLGGMDVLCSDKTGTLTEGKVKLHTVVDAGGRPSERAGLYAYLNASLQSGYSNPIDSAIVTGGCPAATGSRKLDEEPYDFVRKRLSVLVAREGKNLLVTKGALANVLEVCTTAEAGPGSVVELAALSPEIERLFAKLSGQGLRTLGLAYRDMGDETALHKGHEAGMTFLGLVVLEDPLIVGIAGTIQRLLDLGIATKLITGDNRLVAAHVARQAGLPDAQILTGEGLRRMSDEALLRRTGEVGIFAEVEPNQKARIILALKKTGRVVGYMGDGINDASALHAADVGISVADAVDVAKEAADFVLLEKDLGVLERGVREGRAAFANTMKYVFMATSANFGNMFSMAGASLFLAFLPLLPKQVLLMNLLTDLPEMTIATDLVDPEMVGRPRRWDIGFIRRFMIVFGVISSAFDFVTFAVLLLVLHAREAELRTGWFVESVVSSALIVLVMRTRRPFYRSRPGRPLLIATLVVVGLTLLLPYSPLAPLLAFVPLPPVFLLALGPIVFLYVVAAEAAKSVFYYREERRKEAGPAVFSTRRLGETRSV